MVAKFSCLESLNIKKIETTIDISSLDLGWSILCNGSRARSFYIYLMNMHECGKLNGHNDLVSASVAEWLRAWDTLTMFEATVCGRS